MDLSKYTQRLRELQEDARKALQAIREDGDLSSSAKSRKASEIQQEFRAAYAEERKQLTQRFEDDRGEARRRARPVEQPGSDTQAEILKELRRGRVERDLFMRWERNDGPSLAEYRRVLEGGDPEEIEAYERYGPSRATGDRTVQFKHEVRENQKARMPEDQRKAVDELEDFENSEMEFGVAVAFVDRRNDPILQASFPDDSLNHQTAI